MATLHFIGGEKGGTGKSFVARTALEYLREKDQPFTAFDSDRINPDVLHTYGESVHVAVFSEGERYENTANHIYDAATQQRVLVNLPAQVHHPLRNWIFNNELLEIGPEDGVSFQIWFVCDGRSESVSAFRQSLKVFGSHIPHVLVKNWGCCDISMGDDAWRLIDDEPAILDLMEATGTRAIEFPKFHGVEECNRIDSEHLTFAQAREAFTSSISRRRVKSFLSKAYAAFDGVEGFA